MRRERIDVPEGRLACHTYSLLELRISTFSCSRAYLGETSGEQKCVGNAPILQLSVLKNRTEQVIHTSPRRTRSFFASLLRGYRMVSKPPAAASHTRVTSGWFPPVNVAAPLQLIPISSGLAACNLHFGKGLRDQQP